MWSIPHCTIHSTTTTKAQAQTMYLLSASSSHTYHFLSILLLSDVTRFFMLGPVRFGSCSLELHSLGSAASPAKGEENRRQYWPVLWGILQSQSGTNLGKTWKVTQALAMPNYHHIFKGEEILCFLINWKHRIAAESFLMDPECTLTSDEFFRYKASLSDLSPVGTGD